MVQVLFGLAAKVGSSSAEAGSDVSHLRHILHRGGGGGVPNSGVVFVAVLVAAGLRVEGTQSPAPPTAPTTVSSARFLHPSLSGPPQPPAPRRARRPAHALSYKEAAARQERGAARETGGARLPSAPRPHPRPAQLTGPARPARPSALGPCSPPRRRRGG